MVETHPIGLRTDSDSEIRNGLTRTYVHTDIEVGPDVDHVALVDARGGRRDFSTTNRHDEETAMNPTHLTGAAMVRAAMREGGAS